MVAAAPARLARCARKGCRERIEQPATGRHRRTCSAACRMVLYRQRRRRSVHLDDPTTEPRNGRLRPCAVVGCTEPGTHWRSDQRRAVAESVLVCIDHRTAGDLPPIPPPVLDEVGDRLEALVNAALDGIRPAVAAAKLQIPIGEAQRIARVRGLPLVAGLLRPRPGAALPAMRLQVEDAPPPRRMVEMADDDDGDLDDDTDEGPIDASEDAAELAAELEPPPGGVAPGPPLPGLQPEPGQRKEGAPERDAAALKVTERDRPRQGRDTREEASAYRTRLLARLADGQWHRPGDVTRSLRAPGQTLHAARVQFQNHAKTLLAEGALEAKGATTTRRYRLRPAVGPALGLVRDLAARHPPPAPRPPRAHRVSSSNDGQPAEGPGALEERLGRAVAAACRAFLAEWGDT